MRSAELFIALRYVRLKRRLRFVNVISAISVIGITVGVAALLIALSVFNGFGGVVTSVLVGFDPHIRIETRGMLDETAVEPILSQLRAEPRVAASAPMLSGKAMLVSGGYTRVVYVRGIDEESVGAVSGLREKIIFGAIEGLDEGDENGMIIGITLADRLAAVVGEDISIVSPYGFQAALSGMGVPTSEPFRIRAIFDSNNKEYDANYAYISLASAQRLFHLEGKVSGVEVRLLEFGDAESVKESLIPQLPPNATVKTWYDLHENLYSVMKIERWTAYILLSLIILVATFNMLGSLSMAVIEKRRDIAVLKSFGMSSHSIIRIFMVEGFIVGTIGTIVGILLGLVILYLQIQYRLFPLDTTIYIIPAIPVEIRWTDILAVGCASMGLSFLAAYYPARRAAAIMPSEALRWE